MADTPDDGSASKQPVQASGEGSRPRDTAATSAKQQSGGESAGGAYPNPHSDTDTDGAEAPDHGGQTKQAYHGSGQLGDEPAGDRPNANATSRDD